MAFSDPERNIEQFGLSLGMQVADFGAGSGFYSLAAGKRVGDEGSVYAIDVQQGLLGRIRDAATSAHLSNIELVHGDLEVQGGSTLASNAVDAVIVANVFFQTENKQAFLGEVARVLKPRGRMLFVDWKDAFGGMGPDSAHVVSEIRAKELVTAAGFSIEKDIQAGEHHYGFIARKPN